MVDSTELVQVLTEADDIAQSVGHRLTTAHILLACFTVPNRAQVLLKERGVDEDVLLGLLTKTPRDDVRADDELAFELPADAVHLFRADGVAQARVAAAMWPIE